MRVMEDGSFHDPDGTRRVLDGIVTAAPQRRNGFEQASTAWVVVGRYSEPVEDFFLDGPFGRDEARGGDDPVAWICRGVGGDGTLVLGAVNFDRDRFASDVRSRRERAERALASGEYPPDVTVSDDGSEAPLRRGKPRR